MGLLDRFKRKKKDDDLFSKLEKIEKKEGTKKEVSAPATPTHPQTSSSDISNLRAKLDLVLTEIDSIKTQNQTINERLKAIEKALIDMKGIKYY